MDYLYERRILLLMFKVFYDFEPQPILDLFPMKVSTKSTRVPNQMAIER